MKKKSWKYILVSILILTVSVSASHVKVTGEVKPITEANEQLKGITEEEKQALENLFILSQEIEEMEREEIRITKEIEGLIYDIENLDKSIIKEQEYYDFYLNLLEKVLISYQRGGPTSYFDILLKAENLTVFIKSLNLIKDISRNTGDLLASVEESKKSLEDNRRTLSDSKDLLEVKREELHEPIMSKKNLVEEQEAYLDSLADKKELFEEHLNSLQLMWDNLKVLFSETVDEFSRIIGEGHFAMEDLNLKIGFFSVKGAIHEERFNQIINDNSTLSEMKFTFGQEGVIIEVPENNLVLEGEFVVKGNASLEFIPRGGTFYNMALEMESINELFKMGPMIIDFERVAGDLVTIEIKLEDVYTENGYINFTIETGFGFY